MFGQVLDDGPAEVDVDDLEPFADAENGFSRLDESLEGPKLKTVQLFVYVTGALVRGSEQGRGNVPASGEDKMTGAYGFLVITADKGLAGAYNQNAIRVAQELLERHPDTKLFVVGEYGRRFFDQRKIPIEHSFLYTAQNPTMARAREISALLLDGFDRGELKEIYLIYTDMESAMSAQARSTRLLPFHRTHFAGAPAGEGAMTERFEFYPDVGTVLNSIMRSYVTGFIYSALIDSFCCEQNARMTAMDNADRNAGKLLGELSLQYNRVRQAAITQEITEISAGARAQRQKKGR